MSIVLAIPNHPWTKATKGAAAVRIAMTVASTGKHDGKVLNVETEDGLETDQPVLAFSTRTGIINPNLTIGIDVTAAVKLLANEGLCHDGVKLHGKGFRLSRSEADTLGFGKRKGIENVIKPYLNGRDTNQTSRNFLVIDLFGLDPGEVRRLFPEVYQHLLLTVKPIRENNNRPTYREKWWIFGEPRRQMRPAIKDQSRFVATVDTAKHRIFQFFPANVICDDKTVIIASEEAFHLGVLSSRIHVTWSLGQNTRLGQGDDPVYVKSRCFDPFPFPACDDATRAGIAAVAEEIDAHRKERQRETGVTLTQMYNVLEKLRSPQPSPFMGEGPPCSGAGEGGGATPPSPGARNARLSSPMKGEDWSDEERRILDDGLVLILKELHDRLDRLVARAYGWPEELSDDGILARLVALNAERAEEEQRGLVRWLRPSYQIPRFGSPKQRAEQLEADLAEPVAASAKPSFPKDDVAQTAAVMAALASARSGVTALAIAQNFSQGRKSEQRIRATLESLARHGYAVSRDGGKSFALQRV